ncbi:hypothetical protein ACRAR1_26600 [Streptomyces sanyensis]|uniref:hypothetical protein n=1 Tax=Streptomyces sanyensis TaxID=568869 RepID=UPI003D7741CC
MIPEPPRPPAPPRAEGAYLDSHLRAADRLGRADPARALRALDGERRTNRPTLPPLSGPEDI